MKAKKNNGKPRFGIIVAATETPMGAAYKKALSSKQKKKSKAPSMKKMEEEEDNEQTGY